MGSASPRRCSRACSPPRSRRGNASSTSTPRTTRVGSAIRARPKGVFRCADGRWIHQWVPLPDFVISAAEGDRVQRTEKTTRPRDATTRIGMDVNEMLLLHHYQPLMSAAIAKFPSAPWVELGAEVGVPLQPLRSPEEALHDHAFLADGCVIEVDDPELGPVRQVGRVYDLHACPTDPPARTAERRRPHRRGARRGRRARRPATPPRTHDDHGTGIAARGRPGPRPRARGGGTVGHDDARRPRRRGHQGQPAARLLLDEHAHRDGVQPRQAQHRLEPQGSRGDGDPPRARRRRRHRAAQHALRRGGAPRRRLREPARDQARPHLLPHARLRARRARGTARATTRRAPRSRAPTGSTADSTTTASRSGPSSRWATPATASCRPSRWCRRSTTATAPARDSSSTPRSCTRSCSTRRSRGAWPTAAATATGRASTRCSSATTPRSGSTRPPTAGCASPRRPMSSAARWRRSSASTRSPTPPRSPRSSLRSAPAARRSGSRASTPPGCRARCRRPTSCSTSSTIPR